MVPLIRSGSCDSIWKRCYREQIIHCHKGIWHHWKGQALHLSWKQRVIRGRHSSQSPVSIPCLKTLIRKTRDFTANAIWHHSHGPALRLRSETRTASLAEPSQAVLHSIKRNLCVPHLNNRQKTMYVHIWKNPKLRGGVIFLGWGTSRLIERRKLS